MERRVVKRYSIAFKQKVVSQIETGELTIAEAQRRYNLGKGATVYSWLKQFGKHYGQTKIMRVENPGEVDRVKQLEAEKQELESALAQAHLKILCLESTLEVAEEEYGASKKNSGKEASSAAFKSERP